MGVVLRANVHSSLRACCSVQRLTASRFEIARCFNSTTERDTVCTRLPL